MRSALCGALLCGAAMRVAAQERAVTVAEAAPLGLSGYARPTKFTGMQVHYTISPQLDVAAVAANGWDVTVDNNRGKTAMTRVEWIPLHWVTLGVTGVYGPERDSSDAHQRSLFSSDLTVDRGRVIVGAELNVGREQDPAGNPTWRGGAVPALLRVTRRLGLSARYDRL